MQRLAGIGYGRESRIIPVYCGFILLFDDPTAESNLPLLLADEPARSLDAKTGILKQLNREGHAIALITKIGTSPARPDGFSIPGTAAW